MSAKEIEEELKKVRPEILNENAKILLDYITNLQKKLDFMIDKNDEKQEKIEKAIEYIKHLDNVFIDDKKQDEILNILEGEDNANRNI